MCNEIVCASIFKNANSLDRDHLKYQIKKCESCVERKEATGDMIKTHKRVSLYFTQKKYGNIKSVVFL